MAGKSVVFVPGAWMAPGCWDEMRKPFEAAGYGVHTPAWPYLDGPPARLRANPPKEIGGLSVGRIVDHFEAYIAKLPGHPLIVGHSFGGLFTQLLLDRGCGAAGVGISPGNIAGAFPGPISLVAALPPILNGWRAFTLPREAFNRNFANTAPPALQASAYEKLVVPTSGKIFYQAASWIGTAVDAKRRAQPLLIVAAEKDRTVTPFTARGSYNIQKASKARTDYKMFTGLSHFLIGEPGCEQVAQYVFDWAEASMPATKAPEGAAV